MSGQSKKPRRWWLPNWLRTQLHLQKLRRDIRELDKHFRPLAADAKGDHEQDILSKWSFEEEWPKSELAEHESAKLCKLARRWNVDTPSSESDPRTGRWYIPDAQRVQMRREIRDVRRESVKWWIQVVVMPLIALVSSVTALISMFYIVQSN